MNPPQRLELTDDELAKVQQARKKAEGVKVSAEEAFVAEFGYYFGWQGIEAVLDSNSGLDITTANKLLRGAQKVWYSKLVDQAYATFYATAAAQSGKKSKKVFNSGMSNFMKEAKVDNG